jgi:histidinol-phosphate/aromatic aminotransferase/cobyric acid decarboxylase-like protein
MRVTVGTREQIERFLEALRLESRALGGGGA